jgi:hypothetical protein
MTSPSPGATSLRKMGGAANASCVKPQWDAGPTARSGHLGVSYRVDPIARPARKEPWPNLACSRDAFVVGVENTDDFVTGS